MNLSDTYYYVGAIIGVLLTGLASDKWLRNKRFLMIFIINILLFVLDISLFITAGDLVCLTMTGNYIFSVFLGAILASNDLIYLVLMPMLIAKNHSEKMA
jgi:sugar phosphate permease